MTHNVVGMSYQEETKTLQDDLEVVEAVSDGFEVF